MYFSTHMKTNLETQIKAGPDLRGIAWHGWCQAGISAHYTKDGSLLLLGAVGSIAWRGYSMSSGNFYSDDTTEGVTGAPRAKHVGKVFVYDLQDFSVLIELEGQQMGAYFGSSVCVLDLNNDGLSDLFVGAPLYADIVEEGRVYVYINHGQGVLQPSNEPLQGSSTAYGRFGSAIEHIGDINMDGYRDVAISAPYEGSGVVYIYHGSRTGVTTKYAQAIIGETVVPGIQSFGISISGGLDMDGNAYQDIAVGAYLNNTAVLFRTQPVINVFPELLIEPEQINLNTTQCIYNNELVNCLIVLVCLKYSGTALPTRIVLSYRLEVEKFKISNGQNSRVQFVSNDTVLGNTLEDRIVLRYGQKYCEPYKALLKSSITDLLTPIQVELSYELNTNDSNISICDELCPVLNVNRMKTVQKEVAFVRNCGPDNECISDLQLKAAFQLPSGYTTFIPLGVTTQIIIDVTIGNQGEDAHQTKIMINYPSVLNFIRIESGSLGSVIQCLPDTDILDDQISGLTCHVGNPMMSNSKVRNMGPSNIPYNSQIIVHLPWKTLHGNYILFVNHIHVEGSAGSCLAQDIFDEQAIDTATCDTRVLVDIEQITEEALDCSLVQCAVFTCYVGPLDVNAATAIEVSATLKKSTLMKLSSSSFVDIISLANVSVVVTSLGQFIQPANQLPDTVQVVSTIFHSLNQEKKQVAAWIVILSIIIGLLALGIFIVGLWKVGFFKRKEKEELRKLLDARDEGEVSDWKLPSEIEN
uniref:Integrin alpha-9-like n=1 Tax=Saccoglossus kowalevskii TaxID=10224 RepID=A0ABM0MPG8_SACKO|nr:PREDICTED: integrin alpha-9-like [Saccoglossus kowalevskii]